MSKREKIWAALAGNAFFLGLNSGMRDDTFALCSAVGVTAAIAWLWGTRNGER